MFRILNTAREEYIDETFDTEKEAQNMADELCMSWGVIFRVVECEDDGK